MPSTQFSKTAAASEAQTVITLPMESGHLHGVTFGEVGLGSLPAICYVIIRLVSSETPNPIPLVTLATGYCGGAVELGWSGAIPIEPTFAVQALFVARAERPFKLSVLTGI